MLEIYSPLKGAVAQSIKLAVNVNLRKQASINTYAVSNCFLIDSRFRGNDKRGRDDIWALILLIRNTLKNEG